MSRRVNPPKWYLVKGTHLLLNGRRSAYRRIVQIYNPTTLPFPLLNIYCHTTLLLYCVQPKLVNVRLANKLQTVHQLHRGGEVLPIKGHRPRDCGWEAYLPLCLNRRRGARHQPLPYWQFLGRPPLRHFFYFGDNSPHFGTLILNEPFRGTLRLRSE